MAAYIGITGTIAAGKGEVARILRKYHFTHYSFGDVVRDEAKKRGLDTTIPTISKLANELREKHGPDHLANELLKKVEREAPRNAVFESIRTLGELKTLRRLPGFLLLSVDAPREIRFERLVKRNRGDGLGTFEEFSAAEDKQLEGAAHEQQLLSVMDEADIKIVNIGNLEELEAQVREELNL